MKKFMKKICVFVMLCSMLLVVFGCGNKQEGGPEGTYTDGQVLSMTFQGDEALLKFGQLSAEGTWKMDGNTIIVTYDDYSGSEKEYTYDADADTITGSDGSVLTHQN